MVLDKAKQKGTGMWTSQSAMELNVPVPTIDAAVTMRYLSSLKNERTKNSKLYSSNTIKNSIDKNQLALTCKNALHFGFLLSYSQGLQLLSVASAQYNYGINIADILKVWKGGCIIRSLLLNDLRKAYLQDRTLPDIISSPIFQPVLSRLRKDVVALL